ncbi:hypothetical protein MMC28_004449 [Mycoblastus sanguinarius]|nr:hypothetical protein [Mycoblastus sanguinarius]
MGPPSSINTYGGHNPPRSFWSLGGSSLELSREQSLDGDTSPASTTNVQKHNHWCFDCEDSKTYDTCDGFKRHVKEHITMYPCMPHGAIEDTGRGPRCVFCGIPSPDEAHLDTHSIKPCAARTIKARSYTRQANLTKHLKVHGVSEGSHLAKKWRHTIPKRYFSCGFCVSLFSTINKQTNHIDDHYKKSEHIRDWDHNKVVRGLLLEPEVKNAMQNHLASDTRFGLCWDLSCFSWELPVAKDLQHRLQLREETEEVLAKSVFDLGRYKCNHYDLNGWPTSMTFSNQQMDLSLDYQVAFAADTTSVPATSSRLPACSSSQHQASTTSWGTANGFGLSVSSQYDVAPIQTGNSGVCSAVDYQQSETREYPAFPSTGNSNTAPSPAPTAPLWIGSTPTLIENHSSHMPMQTYFHQGDHWQSSQSTCAGPMPSSTSAGMIPHPANPRVGDSCNTNAVEIPPSTTNDSTSSFEQASSRSSPRKSTSLLVRMKQQVSRHKMKDQVLDTEDQMDIDLDFVQHSMREDEQARSVPRASKISNHEP